MKQIVLLIFALLWTVYSPQTPQETISNELGLDVSSAQEISSLDNHGGFHGDGKTCAALRFSDRKVLEQIKESGQWSEFPLDETVRALVYGTSNTASSIGPFLNDGNGDPLVPGIQNGYYLLLDRQMDKKTDILHRGSFNFTLGLYDADTDILYYCRLDT